MKEHRIFKTYGMLSNTELQDEIQCAKEFLSECYNEDYPTTASVDDERATDEVYDRISMNFEDEHDNLNRELDGKVICFGQLGRWNGVKSAYKIMRNNLNSILDSCGCDEFSITFDRYNVKFEGYHHDGRNNFIFRELRTDRNTDKFLDMIYNDEEISSKTINYYTKSLRPYIKEVYGV